MKYLIACLVLCGATCAAADPALLRSTLIVADVDRAIAFYGQLGFQVESDRGGPRKADTVALFDVLRRSGARLVEPEPVAYEMKRPDGSLGRGRLFHVFDPDGRLVEVMAPAMDAPAAGK
jgi:hypothetical protein